MARRRQRDQTIFFPWERGEGFFRGRGATRARPFAIAFAMAIFLLLLGVRERRLTGIRSTRVTIGLVRNALDAYRADHEKACPATLNALKTEGYLAVNPVDAWGRLLRLTCPSRNDPQRYDLMSDGPDGELGGLDRVE